MTSEAKRLVFMNRSLENFRSSFPLLTLLNKSLLHCRICFCYHLSPLHPDISMHILHSDLYTFPKALTGRIYLPIKTFFPL